MPSIISRVKIMAGLNIAEKRLPQDGRIRRKIAGKDIDMRVATAPTVKAGERITIRLLDRESVLHDLADIGFGDDHLRQMDDLIHRPHGILLVTGPTGSGKTTTLYACLAKINSPDLNILTIEDPVEYQLDGISQTAVNDKIDLTFAAGLRSFLRHDPDVIMVGEIRDLRDRRDRDPGVAHRPPGAVDDPHQRRRGRHHAPRRPRRAAVPRGVVADGAAGAAPGAPRLHGLPRALQAHRRGSAEHRHRSGGLRERQGAAGEVQGRRRRPAAGDALPRQGGGCPACLGAGYKGRTAIYELLIIDEKIRQLAIKNADAQTLKVSAVASGMRTLREDGAQKVLAGMTTTAEVLMITTQDAN